MYKFNSDEKKIKIRFFILSFSAAFLVLSLISVIAAFRFEKNKNKEAAVFSNENSVPISQNASGIDEENFNILFILNAADESSDMFSIIGFNPRNACINISSLSPNITLPNRHSISLGEAFKAHGAEYAAESLSELLQIDMEKFIAASPQQFLNIVSKTGGVNLDIPEDISYKDKNASVNLKKGVSFLDSVSLFTAMTYGEYSGGENMRSAVCSSALASVLENMLLQSTSDSGESLFNTVVNSSHTNLNRLDFEKNRDSAAFFSSLDKGFIHTADIVFESDNEKNDSQKLRLPFPSMSVLNEKYS